MNKTDKKDTRKDIADSIKQLICSTPMEKITVKDITDKAGIIRPTFYNHFSDKYEVLEYIIRQDLLNPIRQLLVNDMMIEGLTLLFSNMYRDREFYTNAVRIEGQNSFDSIARQEVTRLLIEVITEKKGVGHHRYVWLSRDTVAEYYAQSICYIAITWVKRDFMVTPKELAKIYEYIIRSSMIDVLDEFA